MKSDDQFDRLLRHTARARADRRPPGECIDPETLAAWTDGTLTAAQRSAAEVHAADCERCLAMLAAMAQTTPPPSVPQSSRWLSMRWAAPLTTAAVAITAWLVIQGPPPPAPADSQPASNVAGSPKPAEPSRQAAADSSAKTLTDAIEKKKEAPESSRRAALENSPQVANAQKARKSEPSEAAAALAETRPAERQRTPAAPAAAAPVPPPADARADARDQTVLQRFAAQPVVITSPDPSIRWRILDRGVQHSTDAGRTWTAQQPQVEGELLAGASPAPNVCWIAGGKGIVLLTTDGETWRRIAFPDPTASLVAVVAASAMEASVSTSDGRVYRTTDGGRTWTLQEIRGPSF